MSRDRKMILRVIASLGVVLLLTGALHQLRKGGGAAADFICAVTSGIDVNIEIKDGASGSEIAQQLFEADVVKSSRAFFAIAVSDTRSSRIAPGVHRIQQGLCAQDALDQLLDARRIVGLVKVLEGAWNQEIFQELEKSGFAKNDIQKASSNFILPNGFHNLEGLLFPAQYSFAPGTNINGALTQMVVRGLGEISKSGIDSGTGNYSRQQLLVIASVIQAEGDTKDFAKVSRVIRNRLETGMPLQMDSTVHYIKKVRGEIFLSTQSTLLKSPYNTYSNYGLPPGPIGNPGYDAMYAAVNPAAGDWIYFITVAPGDTRFTASNQQFNLWKIEYKKNLRDGLFRRAK
ncbi:MAG: endolytic transglycosylase MltG [Candidatus Planktophila sp.]